MPPSKTNTLSHYMFRATRRQVWKEMEKPKVFGTLGSSNLLSSPPLTRNGTNRILVYAGCFNPPHLGHANLLKTALQWSGTDFNIVGAIIMPLPDYRCRSKVADDDLVLTRSRRVQLWQKHLRNDPDMIEKCWLLQPADDVDDGDAWEILSICLQAFTKEDGYNLRLVNLMGPDNIDLRTESIDIPGWGCDDVMISDIARKADFVHDDIQQLVLTRLPGCTKWEPVKDRFETYSYLRQCWPEHFEGEVRFISSARKRDDISSTLIRDMLVTLDGIPYKERLKIMQRLVLAPKTSMRMLSHNVQLRDLTLSALKARYIKR